MQAEWRKIDTSSSGTEIEESSRLEAPGAIRVNRLYRGGVELTFTGDKSQGHTEGWTRHNTVRIVMSDQECEKLKGLL